MPIAYNNLTLFLSFNKNSADSWTTQTPLVHLYAGAFFHYMLDWVLGCRTGDTEDWLWTFRWISIVG